jgi:hypothetical protein
VVGAEAAAAAAGEPSEHRSGRPLWDEELDDRPPAMHFGPPPSMELGSLRPTVDSALSYSPPNPWDGPHMPLTLAPVLTFKGRTAGPDRPSDHDLSLGLWLGLRQFRDLWLWLGQPPFLKVKISGFRRAITGGNVNVNGLGLWVRPAG